MKLENVWMLLPGRKVGFGTIETEGDAISSVSLREPGKSDRLVLPGLVNCHCHAPMTLLRGVGGGLPLKRWLEEAIFPLEAKLTDEDVHAGALWGAMEMLAGGTTTVADMYEWNYQHAFLEAGMRARVTTVGRLGAPGRLAECIERTRSWNERMRGEARGDVYMDVCVHSEYLTDEHFCRELAAANRELGRRLHVHVSETRREHEECVARHGKTPIAYLADTGLLDRGGYAAHCVWCTDDDFRIMAERDVSLVHNPTSNMKLGSGFARIVRAMELGVNVALGTDGTASNDNLDMFEEMHLASLIHKGIANDPTVLSPWDVVEMATKNGAKALGRGDIGEIAVGRKADFCIVDLDRPHLLPAHDLANLVVHSMHSGDVVQTVVGGRTVYDASLGGDAFVGCPVPRAAAKEALLASAARILV
ncbi:MAG: amidohydrolase [Kiritimatiellae bacterium]|nr:amidohydrolase [Kiritimatiellia bacterium]